MPSPLDWPIIIPFGVDEIVKEVITRLGVRIPKKAKRLLDNLLEWSLKGRDSLMSLAFYEGFWIGKGEWAAALLIYLQRKLKGKWWEEERIFREVEKLREGWKEEEVCKEAKKFERLGEEVVKEVKERILDELKVRKKAVEYAVSYIERNLPFHPYLRRLSGRVKDYWLSTRPEVKRKLKLMGIEEEDMKKGAPGFKEVISFSRRLMHLAYEEGLRFNENEWVASVALFAIKGSAEEKIAEVLGIKNIKRVRELLKFLDKKENYIKKLIAHLRERK